MKHLILIFLLLFASICQGQHCDLDNKSIFIVNVKDMETGESIKGLKLTVVDSNLVALKSQHYGFRNESPLIFLQHPFKMPLKYPLKNHFLLTEGSYCFYVYPGDYPYQERSIDFIKIEDPLKLYPTEIIPFDTKNRIPLCYDNIKEDLKKRVINLTISKKSQIDSTFTIKGAEFDLNGIKCFWQYKVNRVEKDGRNFEHVIIQNQKLIAIDSKKTILNIDKNNSFNQGHHMVTNLRKYGSYNLECTDLNADNFCDYQILIERAAAGANTSYDAYLFDPDKKVFQYSEVFSDYNIEYNSEKNRISSFMKSGVDNYYYSFKNLKENKKDVDFIETVHHYGDTIFYKKLIKDKVIKEKKVVLGEYENFRDHLERR